NNLVELLMKQDQMSMAASIESRVPFLDHQLVEFAATVPSCFKTRSHSGKHLLKRAMDGILPDAIIHRPKKGFPVPFDAWLRSHFAGHIRAVLLDPNARHHAWIDPAATARMLRDHADGRANSARQIWNLFSFELWARVCLDRQIA